MERRDFLKLAGAVPFMTAGAACTGRKPVAARKPNIVLIMADDLGWKELGCYGQEKIQTPHIDKLAAEGMRFNDFYAGSAVCAPSRCTLMTGKHGGHAYIRDNYEIKNPEPDIFGGQKPLPAEEVTIAELLKARGYTTGCFGKWGLGAFTSEGDPLKQGFDRFYGYNGQRHAHNLYPRYLVSDRENQMIPGNDRGLTGEHYGPQLIADQMLEFVRTHKDEPFFLYYPTVIPHLALQVPEEYLAQYKGKWDETPYEGKSYLPHPAPKACYAAMITFMDTQVGRLMVLLEELGIADNTIVFFTSDNGTTYLKEQVDYAFFNSVGPLRGLKGSLHEGGIRVPLVAKWPGKINAGAVSNHAAANYDFLATLADIAGSAVPENADSLSFLPELLGEPEKQKDHAYLFWDFAGYGGQLAVRMGRWKGIKKNLRENPDAPLELYDLREDISEDHNVAAENPEIAARIEEIMIQARIRPEVERFQFGTYSY